MRILKKPAKEFFVTLFFSIAMIAIIVIGVKMPVIPPPKTANGRISVLYISERAYQNFARQPDLSALYRSCRWANLYTINDDREGEIQVQEWTVNGTEKAYYLAENDSRFGPGWVKTSLIKRFGTYDGTEGYLAEKGITAKVKAVVAFCCPVYNMSVSDYPLTFYIMTEEGNYLVTVSEAIEENWVAIDEAGRKGDSFMILYTEQEFQLRFG